jgi:hypothetical protein
LVLILGHPEKTSSEVYGRLDHAVLGFSAEHRESIGGCEVVEQLAIELAVGDPEIEVLTSTEGGE